MANPSLSKSEVVSTVRQKYPNFQGTDDEIISGFSAKHPDIKLVDSAPSPAKVAGQRSSSQALPIPSVSPQMAMSPDTMTANQPATIPGYKEPAGYSMEGFVGNAMKDAGGVMMGTGKAILNPIDTAESMLRIPVGATGMAMHGIGIKDLPVGFEQSIPTAQALGGAAINAIKHPLDTAYNSPVSTAMTLAPMAGALGKIPAIADIPMIGRGLKIASSLDPGAIPGGVARRVSKAIDKQILDPEKVAMAKRMGLKAEQLPDEFYKKAVINENLAKSQQALNTTVEDVANKFNTARTKDDINQLITKSTEDVQQLGKDMNKHAYDLLDESKKSAPFFDATESKGQVKDILNELKLSRTADKTEVSRWQKILDQLKRPMSIKEADATISNLMSKADYKNPLGDVDNGRLKRLAGTLDDELIKHSQIFAPEYSQVRAQAKAGYARYMDAMHTRAAQSALKAGDAEQFGHLADRLVAPGMGKTAIQNAMNMGKKMVGDISSLPDVLKSKAIAIDNQIQDAYRANTVKNILEGAINPTTGELEPAKLANAVGKWGDDLDVVLGKEDAGKLRDIKKFAADLKEFNKTVGKGVEGSKPISSGARELYAYTLGKLHFSRMLSRPWGQSFLKSLDFATKKAGDAGNISARVGAINAQVENSNGEE